MQKPPPPLLACEVCHRLQRRRAWPRMRHPTSGPNIGAKQARVALSMIGYWAVTFVTIGIIEPSTTPPGFTGRGAWAMLIVFLGAFDLARYTRRPAVFLIFGSFGAMLLIPFYVFDSRHLISLAHGASAVVNDLVRWSVFVLAVGFLSRREPGNGPRSHRGQHP